MQKEIQVSVSGFTVRNKRMFRCRSVTSAVQVYNSFSSRGAFITYNLIKAELCMMFVLQNRFYESEYPSTAEQRRYFSDLL